MQFQRERWQFHKYAKYAILVRVMHKANQELHEYFAHFPLILISAAGLNSF